MRFSVFTHVPHYLDKNRHKAYSPYVREIDLWSTYSEQLVIVAPEKKEYSEVDINYRSTELKFRALKNLNFTSLSETFLSFFKIFEDILIIFKEMYAADHIHIRCPGNIGLLALIVQIFFPRKKKTVKYAGNWDPNIKQPVSYRFQKWFLRNLFLTKNMKVLVYGKWQNQQDHIFSFFTASYSESEKEKITKEFQPKFKFVFVGSLVEGKRPAFAINIIEKLIENNYDVCLEIYGAGAMEKTLKNKIEKKGLVEVIRFHGNKNPSVIKTAYKNSHFSILPSKSEGWPKALAEAMFFGCIPIGTRVSCVSWMLKQGKRGVLIEPELSKAIKEIKAILDDSAMLERMSIDAMIWAQQYTLEKFEEEIETFL